MGNAKRIITEKRIGQFIAALREQERSPATIEKYSGNLRSLAAFFHGAPVTKSGLIDWKQQLTERHCRIDHSYSRRKIKYYYNGVFDYHSNELRIYALALISFNNLRDQGV